MTAGTITPEIRTAWQLADLLTATRAVSRTVTHVFAEEGLREDTWRVLQVLEAEHGLPMIEIANRLLLSAATISRITDELDDQGLVFRRAANDDGRKVNVYLSRNGSQKLSRVNAAIEATFSSVPSP